jgi:MFS family permease
MVRLGVVFVVLSLGAAVEAFVYSIAYIASGWVSVPRYLVALLSIWPPLWLLVGGVVFGPLADFVGRRGAMFVSLVFYAVGALGLILSTGYVLVLTFLALLLLAIGGDYNTILTAMHEYFSGDVRGSLAYLVLNFTNLGGALASALALLSVSVAMQRLALGMTLVVAIITLYMLRSRIPESPLWIARRDTTKARLGSRGVGIALPPLWVRVVVGGLIGWSYTAGFTLLALTLGPYYLPNLTNWLILVFSLSSFISGLPISLIADRVGRRPTLLLSSLGTVATLTVMDLFINALIHAQLLFWALFIVFSVLVNTYFLTEDVLKSEYWVTRRRGSLTALVRIISLGGSIPVIFLSSYLPIGAYLIVDTAIFGVGLAASLAWYLIGVETGRGVSVEAWDHG